MTTDEALWVGAGFTVLGALIGAFATLVAARYTWRRQHFNEAAAHFRASFVDTIQSLRREAQEVRNIITPAVLAEQERALIIFEQFLTPAEQRKLHAAWIDYSAGSYIGPPGSLDKRPVDIARAKSHIEALLKCATPR